MFDIFSNATLSQVMVIIGLLFVLLELFIGIEMGLDFVIIGSALIIGGFAGIFSQSTIVALVTSTVLFIVYIFFGRKYVKQKVSVFSTHDMNVDKLVDQEAIVTASISPKKAGRVKLHDEEWRAVSKKSLAKDEIAIVQSVDGVTLSVIKKSKKVKK